MLFMGLWLQIFGPDRMRIYSRESAFFGAEPLEDERHACEVEQPVTTKRCEDGRDTLGLRLIASSLIPVGIVAVAGDCAHATPRVYDPATDPDVLLGTTSASPETFSHTNSVLQ